MRFFRRIPHIRAKTDVFKLNDEDVKTQKDLLDALKKMSDDEFKKEVLHHKRVFIRGLRLVVHDARLRVKIKTKITRKRMIAVLEKYDKKRKK